MNINQVLNITAACCIDDGKLLVNGQPRFSGKMAVADFLLNAYKHFGIDYPKYYKMDHLAQLGFLGAELLLQGRNIATEYGPEQVGVVFSNASASLDADLHYFATVKNIPSPAQFVYTLPNIVIGEISIRHQLKGENAFFVTEDFDPGFIHFFVEDLFAREKLKACVCGWVELLDERYKAVLYLVENKAGDLRFDISNINKIYKLTDGQVNG